LSSDDERGVVYVRALSDQQTIMEKCMTNISRLHFAHLPMPIETLPRLSETLGGSRLLSNATTKPGSPLAAARLRSS
jgi:hypothetical protein